MRRCLRPRAVLSTAVGGWSRSARMRARIVAATLAGVTMFGCSAWVREGLEPASMPEEVQPAYAMFAERCSKCHSLARPLTSGIDDDGEWVDYVTRMRRQPASGISEADSVIVLRFLHYYSVEEKRRKEQVP
jgi:hypothetical protein